MPHAYESYEQGQCLGCSYPLRGLTEFRCPECGRPFDPNDSTTWFDAARKPKRTEFDLWARPLLGGFGALNLAMGAVLSVLRGIPLVLVVVPAVLAVVAVTIFLGWRERDFRGCARAATAFSIGLAGLAVLAAVGAWILVIAKGDSADWAFRVTANVVGPAMLVWPVSTLLIFAGMKLRMASQKTR